MRRMGVIALVLAILVTTTAAQATERRVALVVGNGAYQQVTPLRNPPNDGRTVGTALRRLGFEVFEGVDLGRAGMEDLIRQFGRALHGAEVGLFFYAGHGLQVNGTNYLVPVDAQLQDEADLAFAAIPVDVVLGQMEREPRINLVILDACRDNPLARTLARSMGPSRSTAVGQGLARIDSGIGTLIAYSTEPNNVAQDGDGANSPFTAALLAHIETPGLEVRQMLTRVRQSVVERTDRQQVPWDHSSLTGEFYFQPVAAPAAAAAATPAAPGPAVGPAVHSDTAELMFWDSAQRIEAPVQKIAALEAYLQRYPQGQFARLAEIQIDGLRHRPEPPRAEPAQPQPPPSPPREREQVAAVPQPPRPDPAAAEEALGLTRERRLEIQRALTALGFDTGGADGVFGNNTRAAITAFQQARSAPATGYLTQEQVRGLMAAARQGRAAAAGTERQRSAPGQSLPGDNSCQFAKDGQCDEGRYVGHYSHACAPGTDTTDCTGLPLINDGNRANACHWANDGECDDGRYAGVRLDVCAPGTDSNDCRGWRRR